jgi:hypothetical protein
MRTDSVRIGLDAYVAQAGGLALAPASVGAAALVLLEGVTRRRASVLAALLCSGVAAWYMEYAPFVGIAAALILLAAVAWPRIAGAARHALFRRAALLAGLTVAINPLAVIRGLVSLSRSTGLTGVSIVPFYEPREVVALLTGPFSVVRAQPFLVTEPVAGWIYWLAGLAAIAAIAGLLLAPARGRVVLGAAGLAAALFAVQQWKVDGYSYGTYKVLGLAAPFVLAGAAALLAARIPAIVRATVALLLLALLAVNFKGAERVARASLKSVNGVQHDDRLLAGVHAPGGVALENTDHDYSPDARQHWATYFLRFGAHERVSVPRGAGSYFTLHQADGPAAFDRRFSPDYAWVVSVPPSLGHGPPVKTFGGTYGLYRREPVDVLLYGPGWLPPQVTGDGRALQYTNGNAEIWMIARRPERVRLHIELLAPEGGRHAHLAFDGREVGHTVAPAARAKAWVTKRLTLKRGINSAALVSEGVGTPPVGVGVLSVRAEVDP